MKILVVEDEYPISQILKAYLQKVHYEVIQVFDGKLAMDVFAQPVLI